MTMTTEPLWKPASRLKEKDGTFQARDQKCSYCGNAYFAKDLCHCNHIAKHCPKCHQLLEERGML